MRLIGKHFLPICCAFLAMIAGSAGAQDAYDQKLVAFKVDCAAFKKEGESWVALRTSIVSSGPDDTTAAHREIRAGPVSRMGINSVQLFEVLDKKCRP